MEISDLVIVQVRGNEALRGELAGNALQELGADAELGEARDIRFDVLAHRRHDERVVAQQAQVVRDVPGGAAVFAPHFGSEEADIEDMQLVGQQVVPEAVGEHHDGVVSDRAGDEDAHAG
jgi:hypothetical protein